MPCDDGKKKNIYISRVFTSLLIGVYMKCPNILPKEVN